MTTIFGLNQAVTGLRTNQLQLNTISQNIANVNTPGYTRKELPQTSLVLDGRGAGVAATTVVRRADELARQDLRRNTSALGLLQVRDEYLTRVEDLLGSALGTVGALGTTSTRIDTGLREFLDALDGLAQTPESSSLQLAVVNSASRVARDIAALETSIQQARRDSLIAINDSVRIVNSELDNIRGLNAQIVRGQALRQSVGDLEDQRDEAVRRLSEQMDVQTFKRESGDLVVFTPSGYTLIDGQNPINGLGNLYLNAPAVPASINASVVYKPSGGYGSAPATAGGIGGIQLGSRDLNGNFAAGTGSDITLGIRGGRLAGLIEARDRALPSVTQELDTLSDMLRGIFVDDRVTTAGGVGITGTGANEVPAGVNTNAANTIYLYNGQDPSTAGSAVTATVNQTIPAAPTPPLTVSRLDTAGGDNFTFFTMGTGANPGAATAVTDAPNGSYGRSANLQINASLDPLQGGLPSRLYQAPDLGGENLAQTLARRARASVTVNFASGNLQPGAYTISQFSAGITSTTASLKNASNSSVQYQETFIVNLNTRLAEIEGVNIDEEMAKLIQFQNAYAASARVIQAADELLEILLGIGR